MKRYEKQNGFRKIELLHREIHENVSVIINQFEEKSLKDINQAIKEVLKYRDDFIDVFNDFFLN
jgi:hypothetical protein